LKSNNEYTIVHEHEFVSGHYNDWYFITVTYSLDISLLKQSVNYVHKQDYWLDM
jgi:hypothetical protein